MSLFKAPVSIDATLAKTQARSAENQYGSKKGSAAHVESPVQSAEAISNGIYERSLPSLHFLRWRPMYHMLAANAWMNDPCAPGYDSTTGLYHLSFQWNPRRNVYGKIAWGSIAWGHATSPDLVSWTVSGAPSIKPEKWYDKEGCFTGCMYPAAVDGSDGLTIFYTGVSRLPLHHSLPYVRKAESLNIAHTRDRGSTWIKDDANPILPEPPTHLSVTGWRDPMVAPWPSLDTALGRWNGGGHVYGLISGGIKDRGPTVFLYAIDKQNMARWTYVCDLVELGLNHSISRWSGDMGVNWECANFTTLTDSEDGTYRRELIIVGGEGPQTSNPGPSSSELPPQQTHLPRAARSQQWMCGTFVMEPKGDGTLVPKLKYTMGGRFDHGLAYGCSSFTDPTTSRQIVFGWITEEDLPQKLVDRQNWSGLISLPREVRMQTLRGVKAALVSPLSEITSIEAQPDDPHVLGTYTIRTLGIAPSRHVEALRRSSRELSLTTPRALQSPNLAVESCVLEVQSCRFEVYSVLSVSNTCRRIGFSIFHTQSRDLAGSTTISLITTVETLQISRPDSSLVDPDISTAPETAPFTLFERADGAREHLEIRAWFDESVLEVFVNERCVISTRVYPATKRCWGIRFWAQDDAVGASTLLVARAWDGLRADVTVVS